MEYNDVSVSDIVLKPAEYNNGIYEAQVLYNKEQLSFTFPESRVLYALKLSDELYEVAIEFSSDYPEFYSLIMQLDSWMIDMVDRNSFAWFGIKTSYETVEILLQRSVRLPDTILTNPTFVFYATTEHCGELSTLRPNDTIQGVITFSGMQFFPHKYMAVYTSSLIIKEAINEKLSELSESSSTSVKSMASSNQIWNDLISEGNYFKM